MCCFLFSVSVSVFSLILTSPQEGIDHKKNLLRFRTLLFFVYFVFFVVFKDVGKDKLEKGEMHSPLSSPFKKGGNGECFRKGGKV